MYWEKAPGDWRISEEKGGILAAWRQTCKAR